ncbi:hypothetical protein [Capillibacterium thermochitinicola]|uniref:Uncharacterized protein n=1 Tax=Capillibacterium thermochitinicola TaxID=2699427 RepID=A0A8J6HZE0_9FIRM|nr:hypothetical protein [Capillibacterium thermochitinicola]MBA2132880.1 hypothetical protein [Capillibacterium thermochitinicola]
MTKKKLIIAFLLCLVISTLLFFLIRTYWWPQSEPIPLLPLVQEEDIAPVTNAGEGPQLKGVQIALVNKDNHLNWKLTVERVIEEGEICRLFGIKGEYFTVSGRKYLVEAAEGEMGQDFTWLRLTPEVVLTGEGIRMVAAEVNWEAAAGEEITGRGLEADRKNVKIQAERFTFNLEKQRMTLPGTSQWSFQ